MSEKDNDLLNKDELVKSLQDLDFSQEEITAIIEKGDKEGKFEPKDDEKEEKKEVKDDETIDEAAAAKAEDKDEVKKAYDKICSMKADIDKAMGDFLNMFGKVPGFTTPTEFVKKAVEDELEVKEKELVGELITKSFGDDFEKAFGDRFDTILKGFEKQTEINDELKKSLGDISETVEKIASTDKMFKSVLGNYNRNIVEKGEKVGEDGKPIFNLGNKTAVNEQFAKSMDKIEDESDKQVVRDLISTFNISGITSDKGLNIVKKALNIDFEK